MQSTGANCQGAGVDDLRSLMRSKIHKAVVAEANPDGVGSITIDAELIEFDDLWPKETS